MMKSRKKRTACAIAAYMALTLLPNYAWAGNHNAGQSISDEDSDVTITDTGSNNYGVWASGTEVTIGNSGDPGKITVNVASETNTVYGTKVGDSGSLSVYGKNVALSASTAYSYADAYGQYISDGKSSVVADSLDIEATSDTGCAAGVYNSGENSITAGGNVSIAATSVSDKAYGIQNEGSNSITAESVEITANAGDAARGIYIDSNSVNSIKADENVSITAYSANASAWGIYNLATNSIEAGSLDIAASTGGAAWGIYNIDSNTINADGNVSIEATSASESAWGLSNYGDNSIEAGSLDITASAENNATGIEIASGSNSITADGNVSIEATSASGSAWGISNISDNSIEAGSLDISANAAYYAIGAANAGNNRIAADGAVSITADATSNGSTDGLAYGIYNEGENSITAGSVEIYVYAGDAAAGISNIDSNTINADGAVSIAATSDYDAAKGVYNGGENIITVGSLVITANAASEADGIENYAANSITAAGNVSIAAASASDEADGIYNEGENSITAAGEVGIAATSTNAEAYGIYNEGDNDIEAGSLAIAANAANEADGISNTGSNSIIAAGNVSITADSDSDEAYGIGNGGDNSIEAAGSVEIAASGANATLGIYNEGDNGITADGNVSITADSANDVANGIHNEGDNSITAGGNISIAATSASDEADGIYNEGDNSITAGGNISIEAASDSDDAYGIYNTGDNSLEAGSLEIYAYAGDEADSAYNTASNSLTADGVYNTDDDEPIVAAAIYNEGSSSIDVTGNISIEAFSASDEAYGIQNSGDNSITAGSLDIAVSADGQAAGINNTGKNSTDSITVAGAASIAATSANSAAVGVYNEGVNSVTTIEAGSLDIVATATNETATSANAAVGIYNYTSGTNSVTADGGEVSITAASAGDSAWGIFNYKCGENSIEAGSVDIAVSAADQAMGVYNYYSDPNSITAEGEVSIAATSADYKAYGIYNISENSIEAGSLEITISAADQAMGVYNAAGSSSIDVTGNISIETTSASAEAYGINNASENSIEAGSLEITVSAADRAMGVYNLYANSITADGEVSIAATSANGGAAGVINGDTNNIDAGSVEITTNAAGNAISVYNVAGSNSITADEEVSIAATSADGDAYGLYIDAGENTIEAGSLEIAVSADGNAEGIKAVAANTIDADENVSITANSLSGSAWGIAVEGNNSIEAGSVEINVSGANAATGIVNEYSNSINSITADGNVSVTADSDNGEAWGIVNAGESSITAEAVDVTASSEAQSAYAVLNSGDAAMVIDADSINIAASALAGAYAVEADGSSSDDVVSSITLGNDNSDIIVSVTAEEDAAVGILACAQGAEVIVNGESLAVNSTATGDGLAVGIHVENYTQDETASANAAHLVINAQSTTVTSDDTGLSAVSNGQMDINGNLTVDADQAINISGYATMNINASEENTVVLNGDIVFDAVNPTQGVATISDATLNLNLTDADSSWTGNTYTTYYKDSASTDVTGFSLSLSNGAAWNVTDVSDKYTDDGSVVVAKLAVNDLTSDGGVISLTDGGTAAVENITLTGEGLTVNVENDGGELEYETMTGDGGLTKTGDGTFALSGAVAYTGVTTVEAGTLDVGSTTLASEELTIYSGATFASAADQNFSTLNVNAAEGGTATYDGNLSVTDGTLNFITSVAPDAALLTVTGDADVSGSTYNIGVSGGTQIAEGTTLTLIETDGTLTSTGLTEGQQVGTITIGSTISQAITADLSLANNGSAITAVTEEAKATEGSKAISESWLAGMNLTMLGADLIADKGMDAAVRAANTKDKCGGFAAVGGGRNRYDSGSSIDMDNFNLLAGFAGIKEMKEGRLAVGAFYEYGDGSYDTYNSFNGASLHGDGDAHYYGGGVLARMDFAETDKGHSYAEFSGRVGRLHNDYNNSGLLDASGRAAAFDSKTTYYGFHVGGGYEWELSEKTSLDVYGRYFWTRQDGDSVTLSTGESVEFDAANSSRLRIGARAKFAGSRNVSSYAGLAWEHEFDGEANATTNGYRISSPSLKGDTGIAEAGITITPNADVPFDIDINLQGYIGKREGFVGGVAFKWFF